MAQGILDALEYHRHDPAYAELNATLRERYIAPGPRAARRGLVPTRDWSPELPAALGSLPGRLQYFVFDGTRLRTEFGILELRGHAVFYETDEATVATSAWLSDTAEGMVRELADWTEWKAGAQVP